MGLITISELSGGLGYSPSFLPTTRWADQNAGRAPKVLSISDYNRFVADFGPNMAKDLNLTWEGSSTAVALRQAKLMRDREIARLPLVDLRVPPAEVSVTRRYYVPSEEEGEKGEWEEEEFDLELSPARSRLQRILTGPGFRLPTERGHARRTPVGTPFAFEPGARPGDVLPGATTLAEQQRHQALLNRVKSGAHWAALEPGAPTARQQMREMARRGATVTRLTRAQEKRYDELAMAQEAKRQADARARAAARKSAANDRDMTLVKLTHGSPAFMNMTTRQKYYYLERLSPSFPGSRMMASLKDQYSRQISREGVAAARRRQRVAQVPRDIRAEARRGQAAARQAQAWLNSVQSKGVTELTLPGYDRVPHGLRPTRVARGHAPAPSTALPALPPYVAPTPIPYSQRPVTGGGVWYGPRVRSRPLSRGSQGTFDRIVGGATLAPATGTPSTLPATYGAF
jgi:hypothetical protein